MESEGVTVCSDAATELTYTVPGVSCGHCRTAITEEVEDVPGVSEVDVDLESKLVRVRGSGVDDAAVRAAIDEAGYEIAA
jgi:copper chaperone